jgi:hypothetical protein
MNDQHVPPTGFLAQESGFCTGGFCPGEGLQGVESATAVDDEEGEKVFAEEGVESPFLGG